MDYAVLSDTPVGPLLLAGDQQGLRHLRFCDTAESAIMQGEQRGWIRNERQLREPIRQLKAYFRGALQQFDVPLAAEGTDFQKRVWNALCQVPYGETASYGDIAREIGHPAASRAVGMANGRNPIAIIVPCHRIIGTNGTLTGYGGGLPIKKVLLVLEGAERFRHSA